MVQRDRIHGGQGVKHQHFKMLRLSHSWLGSQHCGRIFYRNPKGGQVASGGQGELPPLHHAEMPQPHKPRKHTMSNVASQHNRSFSVIPLAHLCVPDQLSLILFCLLLNLICYHSILHSIHSSLLTLLDSVLYDELNGLLLFNFQIVRDIPISNCKY